MLLGKSEPGDQVGVALPRKSVDRAFYTAGATGSAWCCWDESHRFGADATVRDGVGVAIHPGSPSGWSAPLRNLALARSFEGRLRVTSIFVLLFHAVQLGSDDEVSCTTSPPKAGMGRAEGSPLPRARLWILELAQRSRDAREARGARRPRTEPALPSAARRHPEGAFILLSPGSVPDIR